MYDDIMRKTEGLYPLLLQLVGRLGQAPFWNLAFVQAARTLGQFSSACRSLGQSAEQPGPKSNSRGSFFLKYQRRHP